MLQVRFYSLELRHPRCVCNIKVQCKEGKTQHTTCCVLTSVPFGFIGYKLCEGTLVHVFSSASFNTVI